MYVYSLISPCIQQTWQFTPLVLELSLLQSHLLWGEFSAFSAANPIHNSLIFIPPGTHHSWVDREIWEACPTPLHMVGSMTRVPVTHPSTNQALVKVLFVVDAKYVVFIVICKRINFNVLMLCEWTLCVCVCVCVGGGGGGVHLRDQKWWSAPVWWGYLLYPTLNAAFNCAGWQKNTQLYFTIFILCNGQFAATYPCTIL